MAYKLLYGDEILYDPFSGDTLISDAVMTGSTNAAAYLDFTVAPNHLLIDQIKERDKDVELWSDDVMLFRGFISDITENFDKSKDVTCVNALEWLNDVRLRTYTTDREEYDEGRVSSLAPGGLDELFQWYIDEYNSRQMNASRRFRVRINQAGRLKTPNWCDVSSSSFEEVGAAIENNILENGGYLLLSYVGDELVLDLYADVHEANNQIIDFGVNLLDFTKTTDTDEQYTAIIPSGYTPDLDPNATYYIHIKYSVENPPSAMEREITKPDGKKETIQIVTNEFAQYIGVYADLNSNDYQGDTNIPPDDEEAQKKNDLKIINYYDWGYFWGVKSTSQGYPVTVKDNGAVLYIHVAYATNDDGSEGFSHTDATNRNYIGTYVDLVGYDSLDYTDYDWTARNPESKNLGPEGSLTYRPPQKAAQALTVANIPDGVAANDSDFYKKGDVVYCRSAVARYGYRETEWSDESIKNAQELRDAAVVQLRKIMKPKTTIEVSAVDLALFTDNGYDHLDIGQAARVRSRPHKVDEYLVVSDINLDLSDPSNTKYTLGEGVDTLTGKTSGYIKQLNSGMNTALDAMPGFSEDIKNAAQDAEAAKEAADKAVIDTQEQFYQSTSPVALAGGQWDVTQPVWREGTYIWRRTLVTYGDMHTEWQPSENGVCITGNTGEQGVPGAPGKDGADGTDGLTSYFHIKYSNIPKPTEPSDMLETPAKYIGTYVDFSSLDSTDPSKYTWSKFEGDDGADGLPGVNGADGKTSYLHIAYANTPDGETDFSVSESENKLYMGVCVDFNEPDPMTPSSYSWSRIKGEDGQDGADGQPGPQGEPGADGAPGKTSYFHVKYAPNGDPSSGEMTETPNTYIGTYVDFTEADSTDPTDYTWVKFEGTDGADGIPGTNGADGKTSYLHVAYANSANGSVGFSTTDSTNKQYLGQYVDFTEEDSNSPSAYSWTKIKGDKGDQGDKGEQGEQGVPGPPGADGADGAPGKTSYFHIKYSNVPKPTSSDQMLETPAKYIGTYVDFNELDSTDPSKYTWSKFEGDNGADGIPGTNGQDGKTSYLHVAYANSPDGSVDFSTTDSANKLYMGVCVDFNASDPTTHTSYSWSRIKGEDGEPGRDGTDGQPGPQGPPGADGAPGKTSYFHVKYSPVPSPTADQMTETPDKYIGTYVDFTEADSTDPSDYTWSKFEGSDGQDGADGVPGTNGTDGKTSYLHMAYANSADGTVGFSTTDSTNKLYLGQYVDFTEEDSDDPNAYSWTKIKGDQGDQGEPGEPGAPGAPGADGNGIKSTNISYQIGSSPTSPPTDETWLDDPPATTTAKPYLWTRTVITYDDDTTSTSYSVSSTMDSVVAGGENLCYGTGKATVSGVGSGTAQNYYSAELPLNVDALNQLANSVVSAGVDVKMNNATFSSGKAGAVITLVNESTTFSMTVECTISGRTTYNGRIYTEAFLPSDFVIDDSSHVVLEIIGLVQGACSVSKFKLERGNLPTSWSPAPDEIASDSDIGSVEDDMNQQQELIAQNQELIQKIQNSLATLVVDENGQSAMTQGPNGWTFSIGDIVSGVNDALSSAETLDQELGAVQGVVSGLQGSVEEISGKTSYITIGQDEDGSPTLELGRTDSLFRVVITNDEMAFMEGTNKIAYISNQQLYIRSSTVTNQLQIGQGDTAYVWEVHDNGNLGLKLLT